MKTNAFNPVAIPARIRLHSRSGEPVNAMSVDVEDYFQVEAFAGRFDRSQWDNKTLRVGASTSRVLDLFQRCNVKATFFTLGWVAERFPALIRRIVDDGHELAAHGYEHRRIFEQSPSVFREDVRRTKSILEDLSGAEVNGYRAATFSINDKCLWAYDILSDEGYTYSTSIYPVRHDLYGMPGAPRQSFWPGQKGGIEEYPMTTVKIGNAILPGGGGGYFRILPYGISRAAIARTNHKEGRPFMFYFHPWEVDPDQPKVPGLRWKSQLRHYTGLKQMELKLERLLADFDWDRVDRTFGPNTEADHA